MFSSIGSFLVFYVPAVALIIVGILNEEKLIAWENKHLFKKRGEKK